jgi:hypothetical protein
MTSKSIEKARLAFEAIVGRLPEGQISKIQKSHKL